MSDECVRDPGLTPGGNDMTGAEAWAAATRLLGEQPPAAAPVRLIEPAQDHGWCFVVYWTLALSNDAPPPGCGPIVVVKSGARAAYLGSHELAYELESARRRMLAQ